MASALRFNNLKIAASEQAPRVCQGAMNVGGIVAFKNDTPFSVGRHLRDTMSASLMVANERIHQTNAGLLLVAKEV
jgi:acyl-CoA dehydrogenase